MTTTRDRVALNPIQWMASADGWIDPSIAPPLAERLASARAAGFTSVHSDAPAPGTAADYRAALAAAGLVPGPGIQGVDWAPDAADHARQVQAAARTAAEYAALGVEVVFLAANMTEERVAHSAVGAAFEHPRLEQITALVADVAAAMTAEGVRPALHPHVGSWVETELETRYVLDTVDDAVLGFGPDTGHLAWAGADPVALVREYRDRVAGVHLKDYLPEVARSAREQRLDYRSTIVRGLWAEPGYGGADIDGLLAALHPDRDTWIVIEVDRPGAATPAESIARCGVWARGVFGD
jgi:inosose dehydratase